MIPSAPVVRLTLAFMSTDQFMAFLWLISDSHLMDRVGEGGHNWKKTKQVGFKMLFMQFFSLIGNWHSLTWPLPPLIEIFPFFCNLPSSNNYTLPGILYWKTNTILCFIPQINFCLDKYNPAQTCHLLLWKMLLLYTHQDKISSS